MITAKHVVLKEDGQLRTDLFILANKKNQGIDWLELNALSKQGITWKTHPNKDIAAMIIPIIAETHDIRKFMPELFEDFSNIREGDDIFFLGFPLSIGVSAKRITPIVRSGMVALRNEDETFLIDANVFPGNSGSPVFFKPCPFKIDSGGILLDQIRPPKLLGLDYELYSIRGGGGKSPQTGLPRVSFQENSGLTSVLSMRFIKELSFRALWTCSESK